MGQTRSAETAYEQPLEMVGSSAFGRFPKISDEYTFNMFITDDALINYAGYQFRTSLFANGRGLFSSHKAGLMFAVSDNFFLSISNTLLKRNLFTLQTNSGDVFIDEDILGNIAICDGINIYIYNYFTGLHYIAGTAPYFAGTVSQSGNTITGVATAFTADMIGGTIYFPDHSSAIITAVPTSTTLTVNTVATSSGLNYLIVRLLDFVPNNICFHDGRFITTSSSSGGNQIGQWRLSQSVTVPGGATYVVFPSTAQFQGGFQTKADLPIAVVRIPGRSNQILVMGSIVTEPWSDQGLAKFPYVKNTTFNIDFGCLNPATIATMNNLVVWLGQNERAGPTVMYTTGQDIKKISTDGIDYLLERIQFPQECYGFNYLQSGHIFYVFTFFNAADNLTLAYDFNTGKFFNLSDENFNFFIAKKVVLFNNAYYFISIVDGNLYEINSSFTNYLYQGNDIQEIPRSRITKTFRTPNSVPHIFNGLWFVTEQGIDEFYDGNDSNIASLTILTGGVNYTTATALIEGDGLGANATVHLTNGVVTSLTLNNPGIAYTWAIVTIIGDGSGANVEAVLNVDGYVPRVDIAVSYDGAYTWSSFDQMPFNTYGKFKNRFYYNNLGYSNEFTLHFRINTSNRFVCKNGIMDFYR